MVGRVWLGLTVIVVMVTGCSAGHGSSRTIKMDSGDQFSVTLPSGWTVEPSDTQKVFLFGKSEGAVFVSEADCAPAVQCGVDKKRLFGGDVTEVTFNGVTYQRHDYEAAWAGGDQQSYYIDWNDRTYTFTISFPNDQKTIETVMGSVVWQK